VGKVALAGTLLWYLGDRGFLSFEQTLKALARPTHVATGFALIFCSAVIASSRWQWLLKTQAIRISWLRALQLTLIGNFFNLALPGSVTGDLVKGYYAGQESSGRGTRAFGTILFDRILGMSGLIIVGAAASFLAVPGTEGNASYAALCWSVRTVAVGVVGFYAYILLVNPERDPFLALSRVVERRVPRVASLREVYEGVRYYHAHPATVAGALAVSTVNHMVVGGAFYAFALALGEGWMTLTTVYAVFAAGLVITIVPVAPAGVGTGNAAMAFLFNLVGSRRGGDAFTLFVMGQVLVGTVGALVYVRFKSKGGGWSPPPGTPAGE
jgi:hypothetical protein